MTKDQALDWLAWGVLAGAVAGLAILDFWLVGFLTVLLAIVWAGSRILYKALQRLDPDPPEPREGMD